MSGTAVTYDDATFRATLPFFANVTTYPALLMAQFFANATSYISAYGGRRLNGASLQLALYLMTGHLAALNDFINSNNGAPPAMVIAGTIDKTTVQMKPPPTTDQFQWWLSLTPWGQQLLAMLSVKSAGGFFIGGRPEGNAFRRVYGSFGLGRGGW